MRGVPTVVLCSHLAVSDSVEERFAPGVYRLGIEVGLLDLVLNISIDMLWIDAATVGDLLVVKLEEVAINNF